MIKIQGKIPKDRVYVATSGGVDSMAIVDFLRRDRSVRMVFIDHGTNTSQEAYNFLRNYVDDDQSNELKFVDMLTHWIDSNVPNGTSQEEHWRNERYKFFHSIDAPVITCHHLNDCVETWVWSSMHGEGKIIPYANKNVIRPFRLNPKKELANWAISHNVPWVDDKTNFDLKYTRNYIRHEMMPHVLRVNPGIEKVIKKKISNETH